MIPIRYKDGTPATVSTLSAYQLGCLIDSPLDDLIEQQGAWIEFPTPLIDFAGRRVNKTWMPPFGSIKEGVLILLSHIQSAAQMLLIACEEFQNGTIKEARLNKSFRVYQDVARDMIFGRRGFISEHIMCNRMRRSGRAVLLPSRGGNPFWCEIPSWMMKALKLSRGDLVVVGRDPTIWDGGIECLYVKGINEDVIRLHPLVFAQLNADCDGDQVWMMAVPDSIKEEMRHLVGSFMKRYAKWPKPWNHMGEEIDWSSVEDTLLDRSRPDGFSIGPEDIAGQTAELVRAEEILGKELSEECLETSVGMSLGRWQDIRDKVNGDMLKMKVGLGPVGAAAMNLRVLAGDNALARKSACLMAERIEQLLLDAKRAKDKDGPQYSPDDILELLNFRGDYADTKEEDAVILASAMLGLKPSNVRPMIKMIWASDKGLSQTVRERFPLYASTTQASENRSIAVPLALKIFRDGDTDESGVCKFIIDGLADLARRRAEINQEQREEENAI